MSLLFPTGKANDEPIGFLSDEAKACLRVLTMAWSSEMPNGFVEGDLLREAIELKLVERDGFSYFGGGGKRYRLTKLGARMVGVLI
jgi:hypothetical protein